MDLQLGAPRINKDSVADRSILLLNVGVVGLGLEEDLGGLEGVVGGEVELDLELAALVRGIVGTIDDANPLEQVIVVDLDGSPGQGLLLELLQLLKTERRQLMSMTKKDNASKCPAHDRKPTPHKTKICEIFKR